MEKDKKVTETKTPEIKPVDKKQEIPDKDLDKATGGSSGRSIRNLKDQR